MVKDNSKKQKKTQGNSDVKKSERNNTLKYFLIIIAAIFLLEFLFILFLNSFPDSLGVVDREDNSDFEGNNSQVSEEDKRESSFNGNFEGFGDSNNTNRVFMNLPSVSEEGEGVPVSLSVESVNGSGRTLVDIENILFWADTQQSIRKARRVADNLSDIDADTKDLVYTIKANSSVIGGPSAGAALAIATIGVLEGNQPNESIMISGRVNYDGSMGLVESILQKAEASKKAGAELFLVPALQSREFVYDVEKNCEDFGHNEICQEERIPVEVDISEKVGIEVEEVSSIEKAKEYFFS